MRVFYFSPKSQQLYNLESSDCQQTFWKRTNATKTHKVTSKSQDEDGWNRAVEIHGAVIITEKTVS